MTGAVSGLCQVDSWMAQGTRHFEISDDVLINELHPVSQAAHQLVPRVTKIADLTALGYDAGRLEEHWMLVVSRFHTSHPTLASPAPCSVLPAFGYPSILSILAKGA